MHNGEWVDPQWRRDECVVVEVTGGEWPRGRTNTSKVRNRQGTVLTEGKQPWDGGILAEGEQPLFARGEQLGGVLAEGEQPPGGWPLLADVRQPWGRAPARRA